MVVPQSLQSQALPQDLPFRVISRTIGQGAYAFIRKACPLTDFKPVIAVKFINKKHALTTGRVRPKQIATEVALHNHVGRHQNIISFLATGEDPIWTWIAMELADGDLFDKVEADEGIGEDIAHFYFTQLISAVSYMHSKSVAHRDIKPENILLSDGDMKLADFGLAVLYEYKGQAKPSHTVCGSPPYMAPEIMAEKFERVGYEPNTSDIWSCAIVLFVLLVGNTPWDEATVDSDEYREYRISGPVDELWRKIPLEALSLLRGMLKPVPTTRFTLEDVRRHPWFTRYNPHLSVDGRAANPVGLATHMLERLRVDFGSGQGVNPLDATTSMMERMNMTTRYASQGMDINESSRVVSTQPETPIADTLSDWERPARIAHEAISASQPALGARPGVVVPLSAMDRLIEDPALSQFSATPQVPLSVTQQARCFRDIVPSHSLTMFLSFLEFSLLLPLLSEALTRLGIPTRYFSNSELKGEETKVFIQLRTKDSRFCSLVGMITVERLEEEVLEVRFNKKKGDPLEWRRMFKRVAVLCKEGIMKPDHS